MDSLPNFLTHGASLRALRAPEGSAITRIASLNILGRVSSYGGVFLVFFFFFQNHSWYKFLYHQMHTRLERVLLMN